MHEAILNLIADLYRQITALQQAVAERDALIAELKKPPPPEAS